MEIANRISEIISNECNISREKLSVESVDFSREDWAEQLISHVAGDLGGGKLNYQERNQIRDQIPALQKVVVEMQKEDILTTITGGMVKIRREFGTSVRVVNVKKVENYNKRTEKEKQKI
ncbi:MAG: hypothetical protein IH843_06355 [Thaumarchaeota archaeon]|nr:hypothetical protein [Nitrososphaerota archaeon]